MSFQYGISGPVFFMAPFLVAPILFPIFALHLKLYAPGARTFLQVIYVRFGRVAHVLFCFAVLYLHVVVTSIIMTGSLKSVLQRMLN